MNWFKSIITGFCSAGICFGAIFIICPSGKMEKSVKYVLSLCFLLIIITVVGVGIKTDNIDFNFNNVTSVDITDMENNTAEYTISFALQNAGIEFREISVSKDNSGFDGISCTKVKIYSDCDRQRIIAALGGENHDLEVEVINE